MISGFYINVTEVDGGKDFEVGSFTSTEPNLLSDLQSMVGGYIELVPASQNVSMFVNEEGKNVGLLRNEMAEQFWRTFDTHGCLAAGDWIAGNMVILGPATPSGKTTSAPANTGDLIKALCEP